MVSWELDGEVFERVVLRHGCGCDGEVSDEWNEWERFRAVSYSIDSRGIGGILEWRSSTKVVKRRVLSRREVQQFGSTSHASVQIRRDKRFYRSAND